MSLESGGMAAATLKPAPNLKWPFRIVEGGNLIKSGPEDV